MRATPATFFTGWGFSSIVLSILAAGPCAQTSSRHRTLMLPPSEQASRQKEQGSKQSKHRFHRDADQPKRQRQQPDNREEHQRKQRERPAKHEQNAPAHK